ncbi:MAG: diflavin oxidoreductase, partial [Acetobacteraceae bacterium]
MADATPAMLTEAGRLLVIASTWGEGDPPQRAEAFYAALMDAAAPRLPGLAFAVLALGDRAYVNFCETGRRIDARLAALGAERLRPLTECDLDYAAPARAWTESVLADLTPPAEPGADVIRVDFARVAPAAAAPAAVRAPITLKQRLSSSRSTAETWHLELSLEGTGLAYEPGDAIAIAARNDPALVGEVLAAAGLGGDAALAEALCERYDIATLTAPMVAAYAGLTGRAEGFPIVGRQVIDLLAEGAAPLTAEQLTGLLRPLPPRLYSVASAPEAAGEAVHLLVSAVRWESHGRRRSGVVSVDLADRRAVGEALSVQLRPNPHFRLPAEPERPIVMIGPGTGVAPFRGFMQRREASGASGRAWLFFGARQFTHDFLYQLEWQEWLRAGVLSRLDLAFSRDQPEKIYVQDRIREHGAALWRWLADGAVVYVCGDAKAMARDVHAALREVIAAGLGKDAEAAGAWLREAQRDGRYKRDVY